GGVGDWGGGGGGGIGGGGGLVRRPRLHAPAGRRADGRLMTGDDLVARLTRRSRSNFYYAFLALPRHRRGALYAVYAFCRTVDDIADLGPERGADRAVLRAQLGHW